MLSKRNMLQINKSNTAVCKISPPRKYSFMINKALLLLKIAQCYLPTSQLARSMCNLKNTTENYCSPEQYAAF